MSDDVSIMIEGNGDSAYISLSDLGRLRETMLTAGMVPLRPTSDQFLSKPVYVCFSDPAALLDALEPEETIVCVVIGVDCGGHKIYGWTLVLISEL